MQDKEDNDDMPSNETNQNTEKTPLKTQNNKEQKVGRRGKSKADSIV